jgi:hypothetical protein
MKSGFCLFLAGVILLVIFAIISIVLLFILLPFILKMILTVGTILILIGIKIGDNKIEDYEKNYRGSRYMPFK